jgi:hypothetical protein
LAAGLLHFLHISYLVNAKELTVANVAGDSDGETWLEPCESEIAALCGVMSSADDDTSVIEWLTTVIRDDVCMRCSLVRARLRNP